MDLPVLCDALCCGDGYLWSDSRPQGPLKELVEQEQVVIHVDALSLPVIWPLGGQVAFADEYDDDQRALEMLGCVLLAGLLGLVFFAGLVVGLLWRA